MSNNDDTPLKSPNKPGNSKKKGDIKIAQKLCPSCKESIPVACKSCSCGHQFPSRRQRSKSEVEKLQLEGATNSSTDKQDATLSEESSNTVKPRRTERRKAERPNFFNSLELDIATKRTSKVSSSADSPTKKKRGRPRVSIDRPPKDDKKSGSTSSVQSPQDDLFMNLPPEKMIQFSVILSELNRKTTGQSFRPV